MIYVALLRGINVGGKNKIEMARLRETFEGLGLNNVSSYIASGNVVFSSRRGATRLRAEIEAGIEDDIGLSIKTLIRDQPNIASLVESLPDDWVYDKVTRTNVMFLDDEVDNPAVLEQLDARDGIDTALYHPGAIVWHVPAHVWKKSGIMKLAASPLYKQMTVRNANTARKIGEMMDSISS